MSDMVSKMVAVWEYAAKGKNSYAIRDGHGEQVAEAFEERVAEMITDRVNAYDKLWSEKKHLHEAVDWATKRIEELRNSLDAEILVEQYQAHRIKELEHALDELIQMADPKTNMSDIPLADAISVARNCLRGAK